MNYQYDIVMGPAGLPIVIRLIDYKSSMAYRGTPARKHKAVGKPRLFKGWRA